MIVQHALPLCALNPRPTICRYFASDSVGLVICINSTSGQSNPSENKSTLTSTCTRQSQPSCVKQSRLCCVGNSRATPLGTCACLRVQNSRFTGWLPILRREDLKPGRPGLYSQTSARP